MTDEYISPKQPEITAEQVRDYLLACPDFFNEYPELLEDIQVTEQRGSVVSLTMRQLAVLRDKNEKSHEQLEGLLDIARENDALFGGMQQLSCALMDARSVDDVFTTLEDLLKQCFGAEFFAMRLVECDDGLDCSISDVVWAKEAEQLSHFKHILESQKIKCGHPTHAQAQALFNEQANDVLSVAFIPLKIGHHDGLLAIGSKEEGHFHATMGTLFISHLGELVAKRLASLQQTNQV